jgi:CheY-like chemotaxis protein
MLLAIVRDTTARKNLEKKLIEAKNKAEESDRLKSAFLANTSHEIRTPMNAIVGFSKLLKSGKLDKQKQQEYTNNILEKGNQLLQIINDIIDVSKIEANQLNINKSRFSLNKLFDEIHHDFKNEIEKNEQIELSVNREVKNGHYIYLDKTRVKQILSNLLSNAFKYTDKGKIETGYQLLDKDNILFFVKDTGVGVDKEKQDIIFDSFRKSDNSTTRLYGGTGLGLSISKALVELMGGKIWVESELNQGASFYFTLPYEPAYKVSEDIQIEESKTYNWKGKKILIVEDDELSYEYLKEILKDTKANILHAKDGQAAIDYCKKDQSLDLVLMDIQLPGIDGNTATQKIREFDEDIPVIAQTAYALEEEKKKILQAGCNDYVSKPINEEKLYEKIHNYLG